MGAHSQSAHLIPRLSARRMAALFVCSLVLLGSPEPAYANVHDGSSDLLPIFARQDIPSGNVTCKNDKVTWYNTASGLNPCQQYERLRRICQPSFKTPSMPRALNPTSTPGTCETQLKDCCCNSVAFNLAVTCAACQWGLGTGAEGDLGIDAAIGTYQAYLGQCIGSSVNQSIPSLPQGAACNTGLDLPGFLYKLFWADGALYFHYMYEWAMLHSSAGDSSSGRCDNTTMSDGPAAQNGANGGSTNTGKGPDQNVIIAIVGGVLGGLGLLSTLAVLLWVKCRGNKRKSSAKRYPLEPSYDLGGNIPKRTWRDYRPVALHTPASSISGFSSIRDSTTLPVSDPSTPTPFLFSARSISNAPTEHELDPFDALPRPQPRSASGVVIGSGSGGSGSSDTRRDAKLRTIERHPDGKAPLPYAFDMDPSSSSGPSSGARSGRRRDEKLRAIERHPDGKLPMPYSFESGGAGGLSGSREFKVARAAEMYDSGAGSSSKRRDDPRLSQATSVGAQTQIRSARPPSYATQAR